MHSRVDDSYINNYYYSCPAGANVKNMLKSSLTLWNTGHKTDVCRRKAVNRAFFVEVRRAYRESSAPSGSLSANDNR